MLVSALQPEVQAGLGYLAYNIHSISLKQKLVEPCHILGTLFSEVDGALNRAMPEGIQHSVNKEPGRGAALRHIA